MSYVNVEIKARCSDHEKIRAILKSEGVGFEGVRHHVDTYFKTNSGRLKFRESNDKSYLIFYQRKNQGGPKQSSVTLFENESGSLLKEILIESLDVLAVVEKEREVYRVGNVTFNLDTVKDLGTFVEIEVTDDDGNIGKTKLQEQCDYHTKLFGISTSDLLPDSYSDMILAKRRRAD